MATYEFRQAEGRRWRLDFDTLAEAQASLEDGVEIAGHMVCTLPDGSGGFLTDVNGDGLRAWLASAEPRAAATPIPATPAAAAPATPPAATVAPAIAAEPEAAPAEPEAAPKP